MESRETIAYSHPTSEASTALGAGFPTVGVEYDSLDAALTALRGQASVAGAVLDNFNDTHPGRAVRAMWDVHLEGASGSKAEEALYFVRPAVGSGGGGAGGGNRVELVKIADITWTAGALVTNPVRANTRRASAVDVTPTGALKAITGYELTSISAEPAFVCCGDVGPFIASIRVHRQFAGNAATAVHARRLKWR
jgi:hypothetical protein